MPDQPTKHCRKCDTTKPVAEFHRQPNRCDGRNGVCRECVSLYRSSLRQRLKAEGRIPTVGKVARHRTREEIAAKRQAVLAELTRDPRRTDLEIGAAAGAGRDLVARVRSDMDVERMLAVARHYTPPPSPRTMRAIACATEAELRLYHPSYVAEARRMGVIG